MNPTSTPDAGTPEPMETSSTTGVVLEAGVTESQPVSE